jgi:glucose-1-phosphate cytidylyltransferase
MDYYALNGSMTIDLADGDLTRQDRECEDWIIHLRNTGTHTNTGARLKRLESFLSEGTFMLTYGDGVSNIDLDALLKFHRAQKCIATVTAVRPPARFGGLVFDDSNKVIEFTEKPQIGEGWINGGFMVFEPEIFQFLRDDDCSLEVDALEELARRRQLAAFRHEAFWQCMDTLRDKRLLENLWHQRRAPWKIWD